MHVLLAILLCGALAPASEGGGKPPHSVLFDQLAGKWVMSGTLAGKPVTHDVEAEIVLNHEYARLHEVSREKKKDGTPAYEAIIFISIDPKTGDYTVMWLDNTEAAVFSPDMVFGRATPAGNSLPFVFRYKSGGEFHNTFVYSPESDSWQWVMDNVPSAGKIEPFARLTLTRSR